LYDGPGSRLICIARTLMTLSRGEALRTRISCGAQVSAAAAERGFDTNRVIGFCMGGGFA